MKSRNSKKNAFLASIPTTSIDEKSNNLAARCKFNFSYFTVQPRSQDFPDWTHKNLSDLFSKLKEYSKEPLLHWSAQRVLAIYGAFPTKSNLAFPKHVPHQAVWGRFRLDSASRLAGFILPKDYDKKFQHMNEHTFCCNTFYVVFLDENHDFYLTEKK